MKVLKSYVRNPNRPEACMAENYIAEEAIEFCSEFLPELLGIGIPPSGDNTPADMVLYEKAPPGGDLVPVDRKALEQAHNYVLQNTKDVLPYIE